MVKTHLATYTVSIFENDTAFQNHLHYFARKDSKSVGCCYLSVLVPHKHKLAHWQFDTPIQVSTVSNQSQKM